MDSREKQNTPAQNTAALRNLKDKAFEELVFQVTDCLIALEEQEDATMWRPIQRFEHLPLVFIKVVRGCQVCWNAASHEATLGNELAVPVVLQIIFSTKIFPVQHRITLLSHYADEVLTNVDSAHIPVIF
jgi:hypothetical protein